MLQQVKKTIGFRPTQLAGALLALTSTCWAAAANTDLPEVVARVNGAAIYGAELKTALENRNKQYSRIKQKVLDSESKLREQRETLNNLIGQELLAQAGANLNLPDLEQKLEKRLTSGTTGKGAALSGEQLEARKVKLRNDIRRESYLEQKDLLNPKIDDATLRHFYDKNQQSFMISRTIKTRHILISLPKSPTVEQEREAQAKAENILNELKQGKDFELLAIRNSDCSSNLNAGDLGYIKSGFMPKEFDAAAFSLKAGETSNIVKTRHGLHIIRVEDIKPETMMEFDKAKDYIAGYLKKDFRQSKIDEHVNELKKNAKIEVFIK